MPAAKDESARSPAITRTGDPIMDFLDDDEGEDGGATATEAEKSQDELVDQLAAGDAGADDEGDDEGQGEATAEAEGVTEDAAAEQEEAAKPEWSKPVEKVQQEVASAVKELGGLKSMLQKLIDRAEANPSASSQAQAQQLQQSKDELAEVEAQLADPKFDQYEGAPAVLRKLVSEIRVGRESIKKLESDLTKARQEQVEERTRAERSEQQWIKWSAANPEIGRKRGEALWQEAVSEVGADETLESAADKLGAAKFLWAQKCKAEKAAKAAGKAPIKKPAAATGVTSGGRLGPAGRVTQTQVRGRSLQQEVEAGKFNLSDSFR